MSPAEYGASRATLWVAAVVLVTDTRGRVLVQSVDYRSDRLLPGGAVDAGEAPSAAAARELREELGVDGHCPRGLAVDWVPADTPGFPPEMRFPGEILHVYDGGTWTPDRIASVRLPAQEITGIDFAEPADLPALMDPACALRTLSALRARINGSGTALLEGGRPTVPTALDRLGVLRTRRTPQHGAWYDGPVPAGRPVRDHSAWLFAPDGRVLLLVDRATGSARLPLPTAGPVADSVPLGYRCTAVGGDDGSAVPARTPAREGDGAAMPARTAAREDDGAAVPARTAACGRDGSAVPARTTAREGDGAAAPARAAVGEGDGAAACARTAARQADRAAAPAGTAARQADRAAVPAGPAAREGAGPGVHARTAARLTALPPADDPTYARLLATPAQVRELSDWGPAGEDELAAVHRARTALRLPDPARTPPVELPEHGIRW